MRSAMKMRTLAIFMSIMVWLAGCTNQGTEQPGESSPSGAAGSNFNAEGYPIVNEPITLTMMGAKAATQSSWDQLYWFQHTEQLTNIKFDFRTVDAAGYEERKNLAFATQDLPDVLYGAYLTPIDEVRYGGEGLLIPLNDLIDQYAPNFSKLMEEDPNLRASITTAEGHIYTLPGINYLKRDMEEEFWINSEWLKAVGKPMPTTLDELYEALKAFKEHDPNSIPASGIHQEGSDFKLIILTALGFLDRKLSVVDDQVVFVPAEEKFKEYLTFMNRLWSEDLLDPEYFTQNSAQLTAKGQSMKLGMFTTAAPFLVVGRDNDPDYSIVPPLTSRWNDTQIWPKQSGITRGTFAITSNNPYPAETMRWVDYVYSDEGANMIITGPEGMLWNYTDESTGAWAYSQELAEAAGYENSNLYKSAKVSPHAGTVIPYTIDLDFYYKSGKSELDIAVEEYMEPHWRDAFPMLSYTLEETDKLSNLTDDIETYAFRMEARFITGEEPLEAWPQYVETLKSMGLQELLQIHQASYERWKQAK